MKQRPPARMTTAPARKRKAARWRELKLQAYRELGRDIRAMLGLQA